MGKSTFAGTIVFLLIPLSLPASEIKLPEPAIPGLRYYYPPKKVKPRSIEVDVCVYGGTSGGAVAAVQARRMGKTVVLLEFGKHIGGLTSGGLSHTDGGGPKVCGGIAREFYLKAGQRNFRPSDAEALYRKMLKNAGVKVHLLSHLKEVKKEGSRITAIIMENGLEVKAKQFIDCTYEGDLMAKAGVSFTYGREANAKYRETYNGIRRLGTGGHNWPTKVDPYVVPENPASGLLPRVFKDTGKPGEGDKSIQAFCFRMRLIKDKDRIPFPKPQVYDLKQYELLARLFESGANPNPRWSIDTNNHHLFGGAYFIDFVGGNYDWPDGDWVTREKIFQDHANYQIGVMYFLTHSDRIPKKWQSYFKQYGLPRDEYQETGGWPHQLYIREGRRMVSDYVMTQHNCQGKVVPEDSIGLASYNMDSHHCQMGVVQGAVKNEGNVEIGVRPYPISYRAITPKRKECTNLLVPVAISSSHIAFGSIRMEPVFMILGQSAATAACIAIDDGVEVQRVDYKKLRECLDKDNQICEYAGSGISLEKLEGIVVDDNAAKRAGPWKSSSVVNPFVGSCYYHDDNTQDGKCKVRFEANLKLGKYAVHILYSSNKNRATNVPVKVITQSGSKTFQINQRKPSTLEKKTNPIGIFSFEKVGVVEISNEGTDGFVVIDAVQFVRVKK